MRDLWVIEKRTPDGALDFSDPQPQRFFGVAAIAGITEDDMAKAIYQRNATVVLDGRFIPSWPAALIRRCLPISWPRRSRCWHRCFARMWRPGARWCWRAFWSGRPTN